MIILYLIISKEVRMRIEIWRNEELLYGFAAYSGRIEIKQDEVFLMDVNVRIILESGLRIIIK
jgi:hypothetical protein